MQVKHALDPVHPDLHPLYASIDPVHRGVHANACRLKVLLPIPKAGSKVGAHPFAVFLLLAKVGGKVGADYAVASPDQRRQRSAGSGVPVRPGENRGLYHIRILF